MPWTKKAMRRAGELAALAAAAALLLTLFPAPTAVVGSYVALVLALFLVFLLGCAAMLLSPAHRVVAQGARRAAEALWPGRHSLKTRPLCLPPRSRSAMPWTEEAVRRAGELAALAAAAALLLALFAAPTAVVGSHVALVMALFVVFLLGCAAVLLSPAHRAVAQGAWRAAEAAREILAVPGREATERRWVGFAGMAFYAAYAVRDVQNKPPPTAAKEEVSADEINGLLLFLVFLAGVWAVNMSVRTGRGSPPAPPAAATDGELDGGKVDTVPP